MYTILSNTLTNFLVENDAIKNEDREVYIYGLELLLSSIVNFTLILFIGLFLERFFHTIIFLITFCPLRQFSGGIHASNHLKCAIYFNVLYTTIMYVEKNVLVNVDKEILIIIVGLASLIIALLSPVEGSNKPMTNNERKIFKKHTFRILMIWNTIILIGFLKFEKYNNYLMYSVIGISLLSALMIIGYIKNQKGMKYI